jgi:hypothetical protein
MCEMYHVFNSTTCAEKYSKLPDCLSELELAYEWNTVDNRYAAMETCFALIEGDLHDVVREDIRKNVSQPRGLLPSLHCTGGG